MLEQCQISVRTVSKLNALLSNKGDILSYHYNIPLLNPLTPQRKRTCGELKQLRLSIKEILEPLTSISNYGIVTIAAIVTIVYVEAIMTSRKKTICLSEEEYQELVRARGKHEFATGKKSAGFGEFVGFLGGLYLLDKLVKAKIEKPGGLKPIMGKRKD